MTKKATVINMNDYFRTIDGGLTKLPKTSTKTLTTSQQKRKNIRKIANNIRKAIIVTITVAACITLLFGIGAVQNGDFSKGYILTGISLIWLGLFCRANMDDWNRKIEKAYYDEFDDYDYTDEFED